MTHACSTMEGEFRSGVGASIIKETTGCPVSPLPYKRLWRSREQATGYHQMVTKTIHLWLKANSLARYLTGWLGIRSHLIPPQEMGPGQTAHTHSTVHMEILGYFPPNQILPSGLHYPSPSFEKKPQAPPQTMQTWSAQIQLLPRWSVQNHPPQDPKVSGYSESLCLSQVKQGALLQTSIELFLMMQERTVSKTP